MKFDHIVGNPPYDNSKGDKSAKLYLTITEKCIKLIKNNGIVNFITPQAILINSKLNKTYDYLKSGLIEVDYNANKHFDIGQKVISWKYSNKPSNRIKVIDETTEYFNDIDYISSNKNRVLINIINKISFEKNGRNKLKIIQTADKQFIEKDDIHLDKGPNDIEVICNSAKNKIQFTDKSNNYNPKTQIVIPFIGGWKDGCIISNNPTNKNLFVNKIEYTENNLVNIKSYIESKIIAYVVINYYIEIKPSTAYVFLRKLPEINFSKSWTDEELYKEFQLTPEEINEVNEWYKEWK